MTVRALGGDDGVVRLGGHEHADNRALLADRQRARPMESLEGIELAGFFLEATDHEHAAIGDELLIAGKGDAVSHMSRAYIQRHIRSSFPAGSSPRPQPPSTLRPKIYTTKSAGSQRRRDLLPDCRHASSRVRVPQGDAALQYDESGVLTQRTTRVSVSRL